MDKVSAGLIAVDFQTVWPVRRQPVDDFNEVEVGGVVVVVVCSFVCIRRLLFFAIETILETLSRIMLRGVVP